MYIILYNYWCNSGVIMPRKMPTKAERDRKRKASEFPGRAITSLPNPVVVCSSRAGAFIDAAIPAAGRFSMDGAEAGACPGRSILCAYVRTRTRPGDRARREKIPAAPARPYKNSTFSRLEAL
jgi:hypothetical protein